MRVLTHSEYIMTSPGPGPTVSLQLARRVECLFMCRPGTGLAVTYRKLPHFVAQSTINVSGGGSHRFLVVLTTCSFPLMLPLPGEIGALSGSSSLLQLFKAPSRRPSLSDTHSKHKNSLNIQPVFELPHAQSQKTTLTFRQKAANTHEPSREEVIQLSCSWRSFPCGGWGGGDAGISHLSEPRFGWLGSQAALSRSDRSRGSTGAFPLWHH